MRVAMSVPSILYPEGGVGTYIRNLLQGLVKIDVDNDYLFFSNQENQALLDLKGDRVLFQDRGILTRQRSFRLLWEQTLFPLESILRRVDVIHSLMFVAPILSFCKSVVTIHDMTFFTLPQHHLESKVRYFRTMIPLSAKQADAIIADSYTTKNDLCDLLRVPEQKVRVIYAAPDEAYRVLDDRDQVQRTLQRLGISTPYILFVGTLEPRKNVTRLLEAYHLCRTRGCVSHRLVIVGRMGWQSEQIMRKIADLRLIDTVVFTGRISLSDLISVYNGAAVLVYPSLYEGFGLPVLEAMACGVPVITSNISATAEVAGDAAVLVSPDSVEDIARGIEDLIYRDDLRANLIAKGLRRRQEFSWERAARETIEVYANTF